MFRTTALLPLHDFIACYGGKVHTLCKVYNVISKFVVYKFDVVLTVHRR